MKIVPRPAGRAAESAGRLLGGSVRQRLQAAAHAFESRRMATSSSRRAAPDACSCSGTARAGALRNPKSLPRTWTGPTASHFIPAADPRARLCGRGEPGGPLSVSARRRQGRGSGRSDRRQHSHEAALDARSRSFPGRQAAVRCHRLGVQPGRGRHAGHDARENPQARERPRPRRRLGRRRESRGGARVRSGGEEPAQLRHRTAQLLGARDAARHGQPLVRGQRARPPRSRPGARFHGARAGRRVLRLALVLRRRP